MENSLKQRIIGAIVLAALAIIFLPAILKEKASNGTFESKIPDKPQVLEEYRVDADKIEKLKQAKDSELQTQMVEKKTTSERLVSNEKQAKPLDKSSDKPDKVSTRKSKSKSPQENQPKSNEVAEEPAEQVKSKSAEVSQSETLGSDFKSAAWVVQVASFSNEANAINLVDKLKKHEFKAYRRKSLADKKTVYRVYVGPYIDKPRAQDKTVAISKVSETKVVLRVFDPVKH